MPASQLIASTFMLSFHRGIYFKTNTYWLLDSVHRLETGCLARAVQKYINIYMPVTKIFCLNGHELYSIPFIFIPEREI